jgi:hypothetical protein
VTIHDNEISEAALAVPDWRTLQDLVWVQPRRFVRHWELRAGDAKLAFVWWRGAFRRGFGALTRNGAWRFDHPFFWNSMSILREGEDEPVVQARSRFFGRASIERRAGDPLEWRRERWLSHRFLVETPEGLPLIRMTLRRGFFVREGSVALEDAARALPDLEQLLLLGWVLALATQRPHAR